MQIRLMRALALATALFFGWSGVAAAQSPPPAGIYNFTFSSAGTNAAGQINVGAGGAVTSVSNFIVNGSAYVLNKSSTVSVPNTGTSPALNSTTFPAVFSGSDPQFLFVGTTPTSSTGFLFFNYPGNHKDYVNGYVNGGLVSQDLAASESLQAVAAPAPGTGLVSWALAAMALAGFGAWTEMRKRRWAMPA